MSLLVVADPTIFSCNQLMLSCGSVRLLLSFCGGVVEVGWWGLQSHFHVQPNNCVVVWVVTMNDTHSSFLIFDLRQECTFSTKQKFALLCPYIVCLAIFIKHSIPPQTGTAHERGHQSGIFVFMSFHYIDYQGKGQEE